MFKDSVVRLGRGRRALVVMMALIVSLVSLGAVASPVLAKQPTGDFAVFKQCPRFTAGVNLCLYSQIDGEMTLDKLTVPIVNTVTVQFGIMLNEETFEEKVVGALNEETLSPTPQPVPGGLSSLIDCNEIKGKWFPGRVRRGACKAMLDSSRFTTVNATTELARPASEIYVNKSNEEDGEGTALTLPVRIHLENPLLGQDCYIGSSANPIMFNLTVGTTSPPPPNEPITGKFGLISVKDEFEFIEVTGHVQVDNAFSAPEATGCGGPFSFLIDPLINGKLGLPSPAGYNTIIHSGYADEATTVGVIASEQEEPHEKRHGKEWGQETGPTPWRHWHHG
jgi:hypothetical protein